MPNINIACWTMNDQDLGTAKTNARTSDFENVAIAAETELKTMAGGGTSTRIFIVPEYYFTAGSSLLSRSDKHAIYKRLEQISARVPGLLIIAGSIAYGKGTFFKDTYNVCPALLGGKIIKKLYKAQDDGVYQINGSFRTKKDNGKGVPVFSINGLSIGLDICMDYNNSRFKNYMKANNLGRPDIHIQISGTNSMGTASAQAKVGGVYVHCDLGNKGVNGASAWRVTAQDNVTATSTRIAPSATSLPGTGRVMYFDGSI